MKYLFGHSGNDDCVYSEQNNNLHFFGVPFKSIKIAKEKMLKTLKYAEGSGTVYKLVPVYRVPGRIKR